MSAIIAGEGLGYFNSSLNNGIANQGGQSTLGQAKENIFVNAATGNLVVYGQDEIIKGLGLGFDLSRTYNSLGNFDGDNNDQWRLGFISSIRSQPDGSLIRTTSDGFAQVFNYDASTGTYISTEGSSSHDIIVMDGGYATLKIDGRDDFTETYFMRHDKLVARSDANGNVTTIDYTDIYGNTTSKPTKITVTTKSGIQTTNLLYNQAGLLEKIETLDTSSGTNSIKVYYGYDAYGRLNSVKIDNTPDDSSITDNNFYEISYTYHGSSNRLESIRQSDGTYISIQYESDGAGDYRVKRTIQTNGISTTYNYIDSSHTEVIFQNHYTNYRELVDYKFDSAKRLEQVTRTINGQAVSTSYTYTPQGQIETIKDGLNNITRFTYDDRGNQTSITDPELRTVTKTYSNTNLLLTETTADNTVRYVYDGTNLRFVVAADGSVTEYRVDTYGLRTSARQFTASKYNIGNLSPTDTISLSALEAWVDNVAQLKYQLTEFQYDFRGLLSQLTQYSDIDQYGQGTGSISTQKFVYNYNGNLLQEISGKSVEAGEPEHYRKSYHYDGLGRLVQFSDNEGVTTSYLFDDANQRIITKYANGLWLTEVYDVTGRVISVHKGDANDLYAYGSVIYHRDARGQIVAEESESGIKYNLHDANGRITATVDELGVVTRFFYNNINQLTSQVSYAEKVNTEDWYAIDSYSIIDVVRVSESLNQIIVPSELDRKTEYLYNKAGQLRFTLDAEGYVTENRYNSSAQLIASITYEEIVTNLSAFASSNNENKAQRARYINYNKNGQIEFETDAEGYLTQYYYDGAGNNTAVRRYLHKSSPNDITVSEQDRLSFTFYDAAGRVKATIDSNGKVTSSNYDADGNLTEYHIYSTAIRGYQPGQPLILPSGEKRSAYYGYDKRGDLVLETHSDGRAVKYFYDEMRQLTKKQSGSALLLSQQTALSADQLEHDISTERFRYNKLGQLTAKLDANQNTNLINASESEIVDAFSDIGSSQKIYDLSGNVTSVIDARGYKTYFYYDEKNQVRLMIDAEGQITEYSYSSFGQREQTREYVNQLNETELETLSGGLFSSIKSIIEAKRDSNGDIITKQQFDKRGLLSSSTDAENYVSSFEYNAFTELVLQTTRNKLSQNAEISIRYDKFIYDKRGLLTHQIEDFGGRELSSSKSYDAFGRLESTTNAAQQLITYLYDEQRGSSPEQVGQVVISSTNVDGVLRQTINRYDMFGRLFQQIDAHGNATTYTYNETDHSISVTTPDNVQQITKRDERGRVSEVSVLSADNNVLQSTRYVYDANGNITESWLNGQKQQTFTYDENNQLLTTTDANGKKLSTSYDGVGRVITRITDPDGLALTTKWQYQKRGTIVEQQQFYSATESRNTITYFDSKGRVKEVVQFGQDPISGADIPLKTRYTYDRTGNKLTVTEGADSANAIVTTYRYNSVGLLTSMAKGSEAPTEYFYNDKGQLVEQRTLIDEVQTYAGTTINRYSQQLYRYNEAGELATKLTIANVTPTLQASVEHYEYDKLGQQVITHRYSDFLILSQSQTELSSDLAALDANIETFLSTTSKVSDYVLYDTVQRRTATIDATGATTLYKYDALGRVIEQVRKGTYADISVDDITSLKNGNLLASNLTYQTSGVSDARIANVYDVQGRLSFSLTDIDGHNAAVIQNHYDAAGKLIKTTAYAQTVAYQAGYTVDTINNALSAQNANNDENNRVNWLYYDTADRLRFKVDSSGAITENRYDSSGKQAFTIQYAATLKSSNLSSQFIAGTLTFSDLQNQYQGNVFDAHDRVTQNNYDNAGRLISIKDAAGFTERYTYLSNGLLHSRIDKNNQEWRFNYDNAGKVVAEFSPRLESIQTLVDGEYQNVQGYAVKQYKYDATGNIISISEGVHKGSIIPEQIIFFGQVRETTFAYDAAGRQIKVGQPEAENAPPTWSVTEYDALGRAIRSAVYIDPSDNFLLIAKTASQKHHIYDAAGRLLFELDATEVTLNTTIKANVTQYQYDALGNQTSVTRFADSLNLQWLNDNTSWTFGQPLTTGDIFASQTIDGVTEYALKTDAASDRTITTSYYANGFKKAVKEPARMYFYIDASGNIDEAIGSPTTEFTYNAFGEIWKTSVYSHRSTEWRGSDNYRGFVAEDNWVDSYSYYNNLGLKIATVDAEGYLTNWQYNSFGQVKEQTEYARALKGLVFTADTPPQPPIAGDSIIGYDRRRTYSYDTLGRLLTETSHNNDLWLRNDAESTISALETIETVNSYDALGQLTTVRQNGVLTSDLQYDALGNVIRTASASFDALISTDAAVINSATDLQSSSVYNNTQQVTTYQYDVFGNAITITQLGNVTDNNIVTRHQYNSRGQAIKTTNALGHSVSTEFDYAGRVTSTTRSYTEASDVFSYQVYQFITEYDQEHHRYWTRKAAMPEWLTFDIATGTFTGRASTAGSVTLYVEATINGEARNKSITLTYTGGQMVNTSLTGWPTVTINSIEKKVLQTYNYNAQGQLIYQALKLQQDGLPTVTESWDNYSYNSFGEVIKENGVYYKYDLSGNVVETNKGDGSVKQNDFDLAGRVIATNSLEKGQTSYIYDALGRIVIAKLPSFVLWGEWVREPQINQQFDRWGNVIHYTDENGYVYRYQYNSQNKVTVEIKPDVIDVNEIGQVSVVSPTTHYRYDANGNLLETEDHYGNKTGQVFNALGQVVQTIDALSNRNYYAFDNFGRQVASQNSAGLITTTKYNALGQVTVVGDIRQQSETGSYYNHNLSIYLYNDLGQRSTQLDAAGFAYQYKYDARGNIIYAKTPEGQVKEYAYDRYGYKTLERYSNVYASNDQNQNTWQYTEFGKLISHNDLAGKNYTYTYEIYEFTNYDDSITTLELNRLMSVTSEHGQNLTYTYYENGWLKSVKDNVTGAYSEYSYDLAGQIFTETTSSVNAFGEEETFTTNTTYDSHGRIKDAYTIGDTGEVLSKIIYSYDALGNRRSIKAWNGYEGQIPYGYTYSTPSSSDEDINVQVHANQEIPPQRIRFNDGGYYSDGLSLEYRFKLNGQIMSLNDIQLQYPWLNIEIDENSFDELVISGTPPQSLTGKSFHFEITASNGYLVSKPFNICIEVQDKAEWSPIRNQYLSQNTPSWTVDNRTSVDISSYLKNNAGATYRIGVATANGVNGPVDVSEALDQDALALGILAINPSYNGDVEQLTLSLIATVNGVDIASDSFTVVLDYSPTTETEKILTVAAGTPLNEMLLLSDRNITTSNTWLDDAITNQTLSYTFSLDWEEVIPDSNGMINSWLKITATNDGVLISSVGDVPHSAVNDWPYNLRIEATDGTNIVESYVEIQVLTGANEAPSGDIPDIATAEGAAFTYNIASYLIDPNGDNVSYSAQAFIRQYEPGTGLWVDTPTTMPEGLSFSNEGLLSGTPGSNSQGEYVIKVTADDGSTSASREFTLTINDNNSPVAGNLPVKNFHQEQNVNFSIASYFSDADGEALTYAATGLPAGISIDPITGVISGYLPAGSIGSYTVTITATDPHGAAANGTFSFIVNIQSGNRAPVASAIPAQISTPYRMYSLSVANYFTDPDGNALTYSATGLPAGTSIDSATGLIMGYLPGTSAGNYIVTVTATDPYGASASTIFGFTVANIQENRAPVAQGTLSYSAEAGVYFSYAIPASMFSDPDGDALTISVTNLPRGLTFSNNRIHGSLSTVGNYQFTVRATDPGGLYATITATISVTSSDGHIIMSEPAPTDNFAQSSSVYGVTAQSTPSGQAQAKEYWFSYDQLNRVVVDGGTIVNGQLTIAEQGKFLQYNAAGQQSLVVSNRGYNATQYSYNNQGLLKQVDEYKNTAGTNLFTQPNQIDDNNWRAQAAYQYDELNRVSETYTYFGMQDSTTIEVFGETPEGHGFYPVTVNLFGALKSVQYTSYRGDGNVQQVDEFGLGQNYKTILESNLNVDTIEYPHLNRELDGQNGFDISDLRKIATTSYANHYNSAGINVGYTYTKSDRFYNESSNTPQSYTWVFTKTLEARDTFMEKDVYGTAHHVSSGSFTPASTFSTYDVNGNRIAVEERVNGQTNIEARHFSYSADGKLMRKYAGTQTSLLSAPTANTKAGTGFVHKGAISNLMYADGNYLGEYDSNGKLFFKDQHFTAPGAESTSTQRYTVRAGDTLQSIAQLFYGSSDYWYIIAGANGLSADIPLQESTALDIPARANSENRSDSFKPMDLAQIIGDTTPALPYVPAPSDAGCNAIASIIIVAVAVVVSVVSYGYLSEVMYGWAAGALAGAAGSAASQGVAIGMGQQEKFSWGQVAGAAAAGGIVGGISEAAGVGNAAGSGYEGAITTTAKDGTIALNAGGRALSGAAAAAGNVAGNKLAGGQASFSWANVAASAVTASIGGNLPNELNSQNMLANTIRGISFSAVSYAVTKLVNNEGSWNFRNVATDAFGNALGNSFVASRVKAEQGKLNKARDENTVAQLIKEGATPQQAAAMVAQQYYNRDTTSSVHEPLATTNVDWADAFSTDEITLSNGADNYKFFTGGVSTAEHANNLLSLVRSTLGDNEFANFSLGYANKALTSQVNSNTTLRVAEERGYFNTHQAYTLRKASFTGFDGNMTNADRWGAISTQTRRWGQEDTSTILAGMAAATFAPMMAADLLAVGAFATRGGMALGRFSLEGVNNMGRMMYSQYQAYGARGMLLNAGHATNWTSVQVANRAALSSLQQGAGHVVRNPLATLQAGFSATGRALTPMLRNENVQAGLINGFVNTSYEAFINGKTDMLDLGKTFVATSVGGYLGSRVSSNAAFRSMSTLNREVMAGFIGNASSELFSQVGDFVIGKANAEINENKILLSGLLGAGIGGGLVNLGLTKPPVFILGEAMRAPVVRGLTASYGVSFSFAELTNPASPWGF